MSLLRSRFVASIALGVLPAAAVAQTPAPTPSPARSEYVEVTATRVPEPADEVPVAMTVVGGDELRERGATDLRSALAFAAGVDVVPGGDNGPASSVPEFWGLKEFDAFLLVVDGVPWGGAFVPALGTLDLRDVERIEVLRGAAPVMYGATSFVGVVHVVRRHPADTPRRLDLSGGTYGSASGALSAGLPAWSGLTSAVSADFTRQGYRDDRTSFRRGHLLWRGSKPVGPGRLRLDLDGTWLDQDPASPHPREGRALSARVPLDANHNPAAARLDETRLFGALGYDRPLGRALWSTVASMTRSHQDVLRGFLTDLDAGLPNARGVAGDIGVTDLYLDTHLAWTGASRWKVVAGLDHLHGEAKAEGGTFEYAIDLAGRQPPAARAETSDVAVEDRREFSGLYSFAEWNPAPSWRVEAGLRLNRTAEEREGEKADARPAGAEAGEERTDVRLSGTAGVMWTPWTSGRDHFRLYASYRDTFKPAAPELNLGEEEGGEGGILEPETAKSYEVGAKSRLFGGDVTADVDAFWMDFENLVVARTVNGLPGTMNAGRERFRGLEAGLAWRVAGPLTARATYAFHDARFRDFVTEFDGVPTQLAGKRLEMSPRHLATAGLQLSRASGLSAHAEWRWAGDRYLNKRNTALAPSYSTLSAGAAVRVGRLDLRLEGRNLTDERPAVAESELGDAQYYRLDARRVELQAGVRF